MNKGMELWAYIVERGLLSVTVRDKAQKVCQCQIVNSLVALKKESRLS